VLLIRAVSFKGRPVDRDISAQFAETGGTIGRGDSSTLVLPDPERFISRTHAAISFQAGGFVITDSATKNPVIVNGRPLGPGGQVRLADGDQIKVGDYALEVTLVARPAAPAPFPAAAAPPGIAPIGAPKDDPLAAFAAPASIGDPFADLLKPAGPPASRSAAPDPASPWSPPSPPPTPPRSPDPLAQLRGKEPSIDDLFGLREAQKPDIIGPDVMFDRPAGRPATREVVDPLEALGGPPRSIPPATVPDHSPEIFAPYIPPPPRLDPAFEAKTEVVTPRPEDRPAAPGTPPPRTSTPAPAPEISRPAAPPASPGPAPEAPRLAQRPAAAGPTDDALLRAFLQGAGIPDTRLKQLTPETMESVGKLLRETVHGTLDLLRGRGLTKSEMRADVTMIMAADNNPLKFSPSVEAALAHLLAVPPLPGFMPPLRAVKDAYDDLRAHQLGVLAGMRAALEEVLARFAPVELEMRLTDRSVLDSLLPMNRRAKLWDLFVERYEDVASDAREDFNAAFGKAFVRAYEAQVKRLRSESSRD
jgi:type VI secretion system FHA domain protein